MVWLPMDLMCAGSGRPIRLGSPELAKPRYRPGGGTSRSASFLLKRIAYLACAYFDVGNMLHKRMRARCRRYVHLHRTRMTLRILWSYFLEPDYSLSIEYRSASQICR
ncbi:unnamed protein product [Periconia digitata]|uniref:Uncharacterized protein n=1 Tax=Periconia digitata TaxID=1303443 RepID=A0A9W4U415_9PLEO|nr:unnamed protein product [Periconia digitata]